MSQSILGPNLLGLKDWNRRPAPLIRCIFARVRRARCYDIRDKRKASSTEVHLPRARSNLTVKPAGDGEVLEGSMDSPVNPTLNS